MPVARIGSLDRASFSTFALSAGEVGVGKFSDEGSGIYSPFAGTNFDYSGRHGTHIPLLWSHNGFIPGSRSLRQRPVAVWLTFRENLILYVARQTQEYLQTMTTKDINFDRPMRERLRKAHAAAVAKNQDSFIFEGNEYFVGYAKYLLEHMDNILK
jgi:hypothetical protein